MATTTTTRKLFVISPGEHQEVILTRYGSEGEPLVGVWIDKVSQNPLDPWEPHVRTQITLDAEQLAWLKEQLQ